MAEVEEEESVGLGPDGLFDLGQEGGLAAFFKALFVADIRSGIERLLIAH